MDISTVTKPLYLIPYNYIVLFTNNTSLSTGCRLGKRGIEDQFVLDSGATTHTVYKKEYLNNFRYLYNKTVSWGEAKQLKVIGQGDLLLYLNNTKVLIRNVLYIPELGINLISISRLSINALFTKTGTVILFNDDINKPIIIGNKKDNLYYITAYVLREHNKRDNILNMSVFQTIKINIIQLWHLRLAHINLRALLRFLDNHNIAYTPKDLEEYKQMVCEACLQAKDQRHINRVSYYSKQDLAILERIHTDLGGPISPTYNKFIYYITFLDKKSRFLTTDLLRSKSQAIDAFKKYKALIENQKGIHIKELFSDNGKEYINNEFDKFLSEAGISHINTPAYTKEPNGLAERINLTLFNKVRSLLFFSKAPLYL